MIGACVVGCLPSWRALLAMAVFHPVDAGVFRGSPVAELSVQVLSFPPVVPPAPSVELPAVPPSLPVALPAASSSPSVASLGLPSLPVMPAASAFRSMLSPVAWLGWLLFRSGGVWTAATAYVRAGGVGGASVAVLVVSVRSVCLHCGRAGSGCMLRLRRGAGLLHSCAETYFEHYGDSAPIRGGSPPGISSATLSKSPSSGRTTA